jgi:hypothetical protein
MITLDSLLAFHNSSMTDFQLDRFVTIRSGGTPYGCFFQALRELHKRLRGVRSDYQMRRKLAVKLKHYREIAAGTGYKAELAAIRVDELTDALEYCEKHIETDEREFLRFYSQAAGLFVHLGFDKQPPTREQIDQLDRERWEHNAICAIAENHINGQPPGNTISMIHSMPPEMRARVLRTAFGEATNHQERTRHLDRLANWYLNYTPDLPQPLALSESETREVLSCCESARLPRLLASSSAMDATSSANPNFPTGLEHAKRATAESA